MEQDLKIGQQEELHAPAFELVLANRDASGEPTGTTKSYVTDDPYRLSQFFLRHKGKPKPKTKVDGKEGQKTIKTVKQHDSLQSYVDTSDREVVENNDDTSK